MIRKWIEVTCDYCGDCIKHYPASDSVKEVLKKVKADGGYTKFSYTFCDEECYNKWKEEKRTMKKGTELSDWNGKFPKRYNCQNPYTKCEFCCHKDPCVPDYADEFRKEFELSLADKFGIVFWLISLAITVTWMLFVKF